MIIKQARRSFRYFYRKKFSTKDFPSYIFIAGTQKGGTSALHSYLLEHSQIVGADEKELGSFNREMGNIQEFSDHYRARFPIRATGTHALDATPGYMYFRGSPERIYSFRKDAKVIILLREPISRAFSAFNMYKQITKQRWFKIKIKNAIADTRNFFLPLVEGVADPNIRYFVDREMEIIESSSKSQEPSLIRRGIYAPQLERMQRIFGEENVLVLFSEELKKSPEETVNKVLRFVGLEPLSGSHFLLKHVRDYTVDLSDKKVLERAGSPFFDDDKIQLIERFGLDVPW